MAIPTETIAKLTRGLNNLSEKDRTFARSLIQSVERGGFSTEKQTYWLELLAKRAAGEAETKTEAVGDLSSVYRMFQTAKEHLKKPAIVLGYTRGQYTSELTIYVAGERSSTPGALQVKDGEVWYGRVHQDGNFEHSRRDPPPASVTDALMRFAMDPVGEAAKHGHLTGKCCFCNRKLTDERSTAVGYGKTCAAHFGLAWGAKAAAHQTAQAELVQELLAPVPDEAHEHADSPVLPYCVQPEDVRKAMGIVTTQFDQLLAVGITTQAINLGGRVDLMQGTDSDTRERFLAHMVRWAENQPDINMARRQPA